MYGWIFLLFIDFIIFCLYSFKHSFIFFIVILFIFIWQSKLFKSIDFSKYLFKHSEIFYIEYSGDYYMLSKELTKLELVINKYNLNRNVYNVFFNTQENPYKVDPLSFRAIIGIVKEVRDCENKLTPKEEDFIEYLLSNKFRKTVIPETESLVSYFPISNDMSKAIGIKKYFSTLDSSLENDEFKNEFNMDKKKFKTVLVLHKQGSLYFYIPMKNHERFNLILKDKAERKSL